MALNKRIPNGYETPLVIVCEAKERHAANHPVSFVVKVARRKETGTWVPVSDQTRPTKSNRTGWNTGMPAGLHSDIPSASFSDQLRQTQFIECHCGNNVQFADLKELTEVLDRFADAGFQRINLEILRDAHKRI